MSFAAQETVLPACYRRAQRLWQDRIHPEWEWDKYFDIVLVGGPGEFLSAHIFLPKDGRMERAILEKTGPNGLERQLDAKEARWEERLTAAADDRVGEPDGPPTGVAEVTRAPSDSNLVARMAQLEADIVRLTARLDGLATDPGQ